MENSSKAIIMAGGVLIGILIASFMTFMLTKGGSLNAAYDSTISENELARFNSQFEIYDKANNTFFDIITVANHAYDVNKKNGYDEKNSVEVIVLINEGEQNGTYSIKPDSTLKKNYFIKGTAQVYIYDLVKEYAAKKEEGKMEYKYVFKCIGEDNKPGIEYNEITGKVEKIRFEIVENDD